MLLRLGAWFEMHNVCTGGMGDLGSLVSGWLAEETTLHILLLGRSAHAHTESQPAWIPASNSPAYVTAIQCDIGTTGDMGILTEMISANGPLRAVMHAGGALCDATIGKQSVQHLRAVFAGKLQVQHAVVH